MFKKLFSKKQKPEDTSGLFTGSHQEPNPTPLYETNPEVNYLPTTVSPDTRFKTAFEADPIYTVDDIMDGEKYVRVSRTDMINILNRLEILEKQFVIHLKNHPTGTCSDCGSPKRNNKTKKQAARKAKK